MSRIGKMPITIPAGVQVDVNGSDVTVKGPKGTMQYTFSPIIEIKKEENKVVVNRSSEEKNVRALHGTTRAILQNMITGVHTGFKKVLQIEGVGYRAEKTGSDVTIYVGYSHPIKVVPPAGISFDVDDKTKTITVNGYDKQTVGQVAAEIRKLRPPEPYKGKGIHYIDEHLRHKPGKSAKVGA
ncbi:MAG: 50S ribosomal protein L6 [Pelolinea sp.]|nr:50S ribosomal protein L6 [Pelolinea sp.]